MPLPAHREYASGAILVVIGCFFAFTGRQLTMTEGGAMGAGYFPRVLAFVLIILGVVVMVAGRRTPSPGEAVESRPVAWRAVLLMTVALIWFGATVRPLGFGLALAGATALACAASPRSTPKGSIALTAGVVLFAWVVFVVLLKMPVPMLGAWLR
ncbi:MAG: tripartite tricarboxylate transporter TctB family protein [Pseudomonadota bacterium]